MERPDDSPLLSRVISRLFSRSGFRGPVLTLLSGSGIALGITYLAQLVLARLYPPDAFGVSDYFVMAVTVLLAVASLRYEDAVMTPESNREARSILWLAFGSTLVFSALLMLASLRPLAFAEALGVPEIAPWLWLLPVALVSTKAARLLELWLSRDRQFRHISAGQGTAAGATAGVRIGAAASLPQPGPGGLIAGFIAGQIGAIAVLLPRALRSRPERERNATDLPGIPAPTWRETAIRYRRFAVYSTPAAALNALFARLPTLLLPVFFTWTVVGYYGRAFVALAVPLGLVGSAVAHVFFVHAGEAMRSGGIARLTGDVHRRLVMIGLGPTVVVMLAGPSLFTVLFGEPWRPSGEYLRYVAVWMFLSAIASPLTKVFDVMERQRADFVSSIAMTLVVTGALVVGGRTGSVETALLLLGVAGVAARAGHLLVILAIARVSARIAGAAYIRYAAYALIPAGVIGMATRGMGDVGITLVSFGALGAYYAVIAWRERLLPLPTERHQP